MESSLKLAAEIWYLQHVFDVGSPLKIDVNEFWVLISKRESVLRRQKKKSVCREKRENDLISRTLAYGAKQIEFWN